MEPGVEPGRCVGGGAGRGTLLSFEESGPRGSVGDWCFSASQDRIVVGRDGLGGCGSCELDVDARLCRFLLRVCKTSPRPISTGRLGIAAVHLRPINPVFCWGPYPLEGVGNLILKRASRLDAFSGYHFRT